MVSARISTTACLLAAMLAVACSTPATAPPPTPPVVVPPVAVKDMVKVMSIACDLSEPHKSFIQVRYLKASGARTGWGVLQMGDALSPEHPEIIVASIEPGSVTFQFSDSARAPEMVPCTVFDPKTAFDPNAAFPGTENPRSTTSLGANRFWLGLDDLRELRDGHAALLENEDQIQQHRNPKTGRYDGIWIRSVSPGSIAERHGFLPLDVVQSINGHPVVTICDAVTFVKANKDIVSTWELVVENKGKMRTLTFYSGARPQPLSSCSQNMAESPLVGTWRPVPTPEQESDIRIIARHACSGPVDPATAIQRAISGCTVSFSANGEWSAGFDAEAANAVPSLWKLIDGGGHTCRIWLSGPPSGEERTVACEFTSPDELIVREGLVWFTRYTRVK